MNSINSEWVYLYAKSCTDYSEFEQMIKSKLTGLPETQVIEGRLIMTFIPKEL